MDPISAVIGAGANVGGSLIGNIFSHNEAIRNRNWQENMSNTAHQREVQDLIKAGLNPILSAGGNGSSTPSGGQAPLEAPQIDLPSILQASSLELEKERIGIDRMKAAAEISKKDADVDLTKMKTILAGKGMPRAMLEGEASQILKNFIEWTKKKWNSNTPTKMHPDAEKIWGPK